MYAVVVDSVMYHSDDLSVECGLRVQAWGRHTSGFEQKYGYLYRFCLCWNTRTLCETKESYDTSCYAWSTTSCQWTLSLVRVAVRLELNHLHVELNLGVVMNDQY